MARAPAPRERHLSWGCGHAEASRIETANCFSGGLFLRISAACEQSRDVGGVVADPRSRETVSDHVETYLALTFAKGRIEG
jgi:hypothetical protein